MNDTDDVPTGGWPRTDSTIHDKRNPTNEHEHETENETEHETGTGAGETGTGAGEAKAGKVGGLFLHERLEAYQVALKMATLAKQVDQQIPRGHRNVADHMLRSAANTVLLLAEGANRRGAGEKRQRFVESRGECGEVGAAADLLLSFKIGERRDAESLKRLAARVGAMLTRLIARFDDHSF